MPMVHDLLAVSLATPRLADSLAFYSGPFGLVEATDDASTDRMLCPRDGSRPILHLVEGSSPALTTITLAVAADEPPGRLVDPGGLELQLVPISPLPRIKPADPSAPERIAHVGLNCSDVDASVDFYTSELGMWVTDEYRNGDTVFLACGADHHRLVLVRSDRSGVQHIAFEVGGVDGVMTGWGRMRASRHDTIWGPGRHGPGGNAFCYFEDPCGIVVEFSSAPFQIADPTEWTASVWERTPLNANVWGTGGPSPRAIELMSGRAADLP